MNALLEITRDLSAFIADDESEFLALCKKYDIDCYAIESAVTLREALHTKALEVISKVEGA